MSWFHLFFCIVCVCGEITDAFLRVAMLPSSSKCGLVWRKMTCSVKCLLKILWYYYALIVHALGLSWEMKEPYMPGDGIQERGSEGRGCVCSIHTKTRQIIIPRLYMTNTRQTESHPKQVGWLTHFLFLKQSLYMEEQRYLINPECLISFFLLLLFLLFLHSSDLSYNNNNNNNFHTFLTSHTQ